LKLVVQGVEIICRNAVDGNRAIKADTLDIARLNLGGLFAIRSRIQLIADLRARRKAGIQLVDVIILSAYRTK
jgi:hypothetical protein